MLHSDIIRTIVTANKDKFFTIEFVKVSGVVRKLNGRFGVGGVPAQHPTVPTNLIVYDLKIKGYRTIKLEGVKTIRMKHGEIKLA